MFKSFSCEKNPLVGSENSLLGRNNSPSKIPVVISSMGDENQQNRIQLAVHKYNSSSNGLVGHSRNLLPSAKHTFLKNSLKSKNFEEDSEAARRSDKKSKTLYDGVGAFPTIHLKKNAIQYRPVKRFNDVKVPNPELPLNRFFTNLPEFSTDFKPNTRSVLDVLQDLSSKKINLNDSKNCNKGISKGLGGDLAISGEPLYRPLFVQKSKSHSVLTRDNTTQTLASHEPSCKSFNANEPCKSTLKGDPSDLRVQLRKKLAKQNNEIFASLSSSISLTPTKRKLDKLLHHENNENLNNASGIKRFKTNESKINDSDKSITSFSKSDCSNHLATLKRKKKINEINSTSPNKDRLTTIFLDMQNTSPKSQVFETSSSPTINDSSLPSDSQVNLSKKTGELKTSDSKAFTESTFSNTTSSSTLPSFAFTKSETTSDSGQAVKSNSEANIYPSENHLVKSVISEPEKPLNEKPTSNPTVLLKKNPITQNNFSFLNKTDSLMPNTQNSSDKTNESAKKSPCVTSDNDKPNKVKFGMENNSTALQNNSFVMPNFSTQQNKNDLGKVPSEFGDVKNSVTLGSMPQFSFGIKTSDSKVPSPGLSANTELSTNKTEPSETSKPKFTFGLNPSSSAIQQGTSTKEEKKESDCAPAFQNSAGSFFGNLVEKPTFSFGKKPEELKTNTSFSANSSTQSPPVQSTASETFSTQTNALSQSAGFDSSTADKTNENKAVLGENPKTTEPSVGASNSLNSVTGEKKTLPFTFNFDQKSQDSNVQKGNEVGLNETKKSNDWFTFGQKTLKTETTQSAVPSVEIANQFNSTSNPLQSLTKLPSQSSLFPQNPTTTTSNPPASNQNQNSSTDSSTGSKFESKQSSTAPFFNKISLFGNSSPSIQSSTSPMANGGSLAAVNSTQPSTVFGVKSTTAQTLAMPSSGSSQSAIGFGGNQSLNAFGTIPTTKSNTFGAETNTQTSRGFGFKTSLTPSSGSNFISSSGAQTNKPFAFGSSPSAFGQPSEQTNDKTVNTLSPNNNIFSQTTSSQNPVENSSFANPGFGATSSQNVFASKVDSTPCVFGQNSKTETLAFNQNTQPQTVEPQNKFSFGTSATTSAFPSTLSNSTAAPVFNFGGGSGQSPNFFGSSSSSSTTPNTQFAFKNTTNDTFKFGSNVTKSNNVFGSPPTPAFSFNNSLDPKPLTQSFNFENNQSVSATPSFNFGSTPSPSVFNFGGSASSVNSNSTFTFGASQPCTPFGQPSMPSLPPFSGPGTFSIGSGSSQSRPKASSRLRRRP